ncbi:MAG TPA: hypothetical protein VKW04_24920 [Planctomycetota bacterium]|nr:hypothetical protein [Planctomycetota bacterium]
MKTLLAVLCVALVAALSIGCGTLSARVGRDPVNPGPDQPTVDFKVCHGDKDAEVRAYIEDQRGGSSGKATEMIVHAKANAEAHPEKCPCYQGCNPSPSPSPAAGLAVH